MSNRVAEQIARLDAECLQPVVQQALAVEKATLVDWSAQPLEGGFSGSAVYRLQGQAQLGEEHKPWSLILKVISPANGGAQPTDFDYWQREALLYQSGLLADLPPDLVAPQCFAITAAADDALWLWLEDMGVGADTPWPLARYGLAARHLGQWNGAYLVGRPLPAYPWLRAADLQQRLALAEAGMAALPQLCHHPLLAELLAGDRVERIFYLWQGREQFLAALAQLPQTLCHRDAFRFNLADRWHPAGRQQTIVLDWGAAGLGIIGEELVPLFAATLSFVAVDIERIPELDALIFAGYLAGLRDADWQGDERLVRFGFTAQVAFKAGVAEPATRLPAVARRMAALPPGAEPPRLLSPGGYPQAAAKGQYLLDLGDEARRLLDKLF
ncbi:MAG: phosphotransferase [Caldilineaceae bacterium]|nr:phosphotransferase [Caldilineaceae bacterium]